MEGLDFVKVNITIIERIRVLLFLHVPCYLLQFERRQLTFFSLLGRD